MKQQLVFSCLLFTLHALPALCEEYASSERAAAAIGHYARARAMLVEALAEFEEGRRIARPDMLLDSEEWRLSIVSRTEELNRVLDPQPRVTRSGARFRAVKQLIKRDHQRLPAVDGGAQDSNTYGEEQRQKELEISREQAVEPQTPDASVVESTEAAKALFEDSNSKAQEVERKTLLDEETKQLLEEQSQHIPSSLAPATTQAETAKESEEEMSQAIERAVKDQLNDAEPALNQGVTQ